MFAKLVDGRHAGDGDTSEHFNLPVPPKPLELNGGAGYLTPKAKRNRSAKFDHQNYSGAERGNKDSWWKRKQRLK